MPERSLMRHWRIAVVWLAMSVLTILPGCSKPTSPGVVVLTPPMALLEPCQEPAGSPEVLELLRAHRTDDAATAYVRYVLDVRDAFQICNGQLSAAREYCEAMKSAATGSENE